MIKNREKSVLKNLNLKNTLFSLFYNGLMEIYFTPDFIEPFELSVFYLLLVFNKYKVYTLSQSMILNIASR